MGARETFVRIRHSADGIGKLIDIRSGQAEIEFFDSPAGPRLIQKQAPANLVESIELASQTRVFAFDPDNATWKAGRVGGLVSAEALRQAEDHYLIHFPNREDQYVPISRLFVRWDHPIEDPTVYLAAKITDTPFFFEGRSKIVRHLASQRAAFGGMTALASSSIELLEHQISTVKRVLADPIQRYLLADEVGLGKTIEAGILLKQHLLDSPLDASVLVIAPDHLVTQWKQELLTKFDISPLDSRVEVVSLTDWSDSVQDAKHTLVVIDEAHLLASWAFSETPEEQRLFANARQQAIACPRLLLLSGTPVLHQEREFLAMLHLLDPQGYSLSDLDGFRIRISERHTVAEALVDLVDSSGGSFIEDAITRLKPLFPDDQRLEKLGAAVQSVLWNDERDPSRISALRALRIHIRETYKLHRRLLRTRRADPRIIEDLLPRSGVETIFYADPARVESASFLDLWRQSVPASELQQVPIKRLFAVMVSAAFEHPRVLVRLLAQRLALLDGTLPKNEYGPQTGVLSQVEVFDGEARLIRERKELILSVAKEDERLFSLARWISEKPQLRRFVIFLTDPEVADLLAHELSGSIRSASVWRYTGKNSDIVDFHSTNGQSILVCDRKAEEGLNLQRSGATIIHFDLPIDSLRVEQRIGRLDRIQAIGRLRNVVFSGDLPYEKEWLDCLVSGVGVFSRSVSALQYLLSESRKRIENDLLGEGRDSFMLELDRLRDPVEGVVAEMRRSVAQEDMDSVEVDSENEHAFFMRLKDMDEAIDSDGQPSLDAWMVRCLKFSYQQLAPAMGRYVYVNDQSLVPLQDAFYTFQDSLDISQRLGRRRHELPLAPTTFSRSVAVEQMGAALVRVGNPMLDALEQFVRKDDRGSAFAYWRCVPGLHATPEVYFRFDFFIEATPLSVTAVPDSSVLGADATALQRRADAAFPVQYRTLWLDSDLQPASDSALLMTLRQPYSRQSRTDGSFDRNLNPTRWRHAAEVINLTDWEGRCERARVEAERRLRASMRFTEACSASVSRYEAALTERAAMFDSRIGRLSGSLRIAELQIFELEEAFDFAVMAAVKKPNIRVDSVGIVVLSSAPLEEACEVGGYNATV